VTGHQLFHNPICFIVYGNFLQCVPGSDEDEDENKVEDGEEEEEEDSEADEEDCDEDNEDGEEAMSFGEEASLSMQQGCHNWE